MKHTPGPWENTGGTIESADGWHVASAHGNGDEQLSNARLIAAAPEAIALLEDALADWEDDQFNVEYPYRIAWAEKTRAVIQKIRGK